MGRVEAMLIHEQSKTNVMLRVVPDSTMQSSILLGRDFLKLANLSLSANEKTLDDRSFDILNIEVNENKVDVSSQDMIINQDLSIEVTRARNLFEKFYVHAPRPLNPK